MNSDNANSTAALRCVLAGCRKVLLWEAGGGGCRPVKVK